MLRNARLWVVLVAINLSLGPGLSLVPAAPPVAVSFDVSPTAGCTEVTSPEFARDNPGEKLIRATLQVSALVTRGRAEDVTECLYHFYGPQQQFVVHDYLPKTTLVSDVVGNIKVQQGQDESQNVELSVGGEYEGLIHGNLGGGGNHHQSHSVHYELLPPREMLSAAGTTGRGTGVYFKLKPTPQTSLEGSHDFVLELRVPSAWRADYLRLSCQAQTRSGQACGQASFLIPLYTQRDAIAKSLATQLSDNERRLLATAAQHQQAVRRASLPTVAHELSLRQPQIPEDWTWRLLRMPATAAPENFEARLPEPVQSAATRYRRAKRAVADLAVAASTNTRVTVAKPVLGDRSATPE